MTAYGQRDFDALELYGVSRDFVRPYAPEAGGGTEIKVLIKSNTKKGYEELKEGETLNYGQPNSTTRRGRVGRGGICQTLMTQEEQAVYNKHRIRKLTERECFRLMGVKEEDFLKIVKDQPATKQYHMAGDSIVTSVLMAIFGEMLGIDYEAKIDELVEDITIDYEGNEQPKPD